MARAADAKGRLAHALQPQREGLHMRDFPRHQELQGVFGPRVIAKIDEPLIDDLGTSLRGDVAAKINIKFTSDLQIIGGPGIVPCELKRFTPSLGKHLVLRKLRSWIRSLRPYPSLALFSVPVIILEPVKPAAAYLAATGQIMSSVLTLIIGEVLKLVLIERLFSLTRDNLMKIPAFAWAYAKFRQAKAWLDATEAWQAIRSLTIAGRNYLEQMKRSSAVPFRQS